MTTVPAYNTFDQLLTKTRSRVGKFSEFKAKRLKDALEHGLGELKTEDEMDM